MSTYFDIACRDCRRDMHPQNDIRVDAELQGIIDCAEQQVALAALIESKGVDVSIKVGGVEIDLGWLRDHRGHRLAVRCEYESWEELEERLATGLGWWEYQQAKKSGAIRG